MNRVVVLHCDVGGRPYRIDDFRQPLKDTGVIQEVCGIGAYQMSHVWLINFRTDGAKKKLLESGPLSVKGRPCLVVDPVRHELRVKLHWVAFNVTNETIRKIFAEYGDVKEVTSDKWRVQDFESSESTTRIVRLVLHEGVTPDRLPHQLRLGPGTALVAVPGRAPLCGAAEPGTFAENAGPPGARNATPLGTRRRTAPARTLGLWVEAWKVTTANSLWTRKKQREQRHPQHLNPGPTTTPSRKRTRIPQERTRASH